MSVWDVKNSTHIDIRTGMGVDIHAFEDAEFEMHNTYHHNTQDCDHCNDHNAKDRFIVIGGIQIRSQNIIKAHSDGDILLHAIADAIYGCIKCGNIGTFFPSSDCRWKKCDSSVFVKHALNMAGSHGWSIAYIDNCIICEEPKIMPHNMLISKNIASILGINENMVNIKGTTPEGLPFMGVNHGIVALSICTMIKPKSHRPTFNTGS